MAQPCMAPPSTHHQAPAPAPGQGASPSCINKVCPNQALHAAATHIPPPKCHTQALAQGVTLKLDPAQATSQKIKKRALLVKAPAAMGDQKMKAQILMALAARARSLPVRMRSQGVAMAAVPQNQRKKL